MKTTLVNGKGDSHRSVNKKYWKNFEEVNWGKPEKITRKVYGAQFVIGSFIKIGEDNAVQNQKAW